MSNAIFPKIIMRERRIKIKSHSKHDSHKYEYKRGQKPVLWNKRPLKSLFADSGFLVLKGFRTTNAENIHTFTIKKFIAFMALHVQFV